MLKFFALLNVAQNLYLLQQYCCHIHTEAWKHRQLFLIVTVFSVIYILLTVLSVQLYIREHPMAQVFWSCVTHLKDHVSSSERTKFHLVQYIFCEASQKWNHIYSCLCCG